MGLFDFLGNAHQGFLKGVAPGHVQNRELARKQASQQIQMNQHSMDMDKQKMSMLQKKQMFEQMVQLPDALARYSEAVHSGDAVAEPMRRFFKMMDYPDELITIAERMSPEETRMTLQQHLEAAQNYAPEGHELKTFGMGAQGKPYFEFGTPESEEEATTKAQQVQLENAGVIANAAAGLQSAVKDGMNPQLASSILDMLGQTAGIKAPTGLFTSPEDDESEKLARDTVNVKNATSLIKQGQDILASIPQGADAVFMPDKQRKELHDLGTELIERGRSFISSGEETKVVEEPQPEPQQDSSSFVPVAQPQQQELPAPPPEAVAPVEADTGLWQRFKERGKVGKEGVTAKKIKKQETADDDMLFKALPLTWKNKLKEKWHTLDDVDKRRVVALSGDRNVTVDEVLAELE